ncbi:DNA glycosylase [Trametes gibbosa]|nr:DNA glycosylase [Trametes gibbosa]
MSPPNNTRSPYFSSSKHSSLHQLQAATCSSKSCFFTEPDVGTALLHDPAFRCFYEEFVHAMHLLYQAKPILIQEHVAADPWKVLVAVTLLNKTAGKHAIPVFFEIVDRWPTPAALADAPRSLLQELVQHLGLGEMRTSRLIDISQTYLADPPTSDRSRRSRGKLLLPNADGEHMQRSHYPPTPVSHFPGCGPYALDSYRVFCSGNDEWKSVRPRDKELARYLRWKWAIEEYRQWHPLHGTGPPIDLIYVRSMVSDLTSDPISH